VATNEVQTEETTLENIGNETVEITAGKAVGDISVTIGSTFATINGNSYDMSAAPYIQYASNSTLVPLRFVALAICGDVDNQDNSNSVSWDADTKTATIIAKGKVISFTVGSDVAYINNKPMIMEHGVKAEISSNRLYIPFRVLGKALDVDVDWNEETKTATFKTE
jgi:hypothetical protein